MSKAQPQTMTPNKQLAMQASAQLQAGNPGLALQTCEMVLSVDDQHADALVVAGLAHKQMGNWTQAVALMRKAVAARRPDPMHIFHLATTYVEMGKPTDGLRWFERYAEISPTGEAWNNIGITLLQLGRNAEAVGPLKKAVKMARNRANIRANYGVALHNTGKLEEAETELRKSLELQPDLPDGLLNLGNTLDKSGRHREALQVYYDMIAKGINLQPALMNCANLEQRLGRYHIAEAQYRRAIALAPNTLQLWTNWLFCLLHDENATPETVFEGHKKFAAQFEPALRAEHKAHTNDKDPNRRIRVGFVSADLRSHSVAFFFKSLLTELGTSAGLELHAYSNSNKSDSLTEGLKAQFAGWTDVFHLNDEELAKRVRADGIDILIDMSGHTAGHRLLTFARKPAPVQASWMGYPGTTGLSSMDYYMADPYFLPPGQLDSQFSEKIVQLPASVCFLPYENAPPVQALPALAHGHLTFGSFSHLRKLNRSTVALWAKLLRAVPDAKLVLGGMPKDESLTDLQSWFDEEGIDASRLTLRTTCPMEEYLAMHHLVDIHLDTSPYNGGTTTWHAITMGVPSISLAGATPASRAGASILGQVGLQEFTANSEEEYVAIAVRWAGQIPALAELRAGMRRRFEQSAPNHPLLVAKWVGQSLRTMWKTWCAGSAPQSFAVAREVSGN